MSSKKIKIDKRLFPHKENHVHNHLFSDKYNYDGDYNIKTKILLTQYNQEKLEWKKVEPDVESFRELMEPDCLNWLPITGLNDSKLIQRILKEFSFHDVDAKPVLTPCHAAKIDDFNSRLIIVIRPCFFETNEKIVSEHICIIARDNLVITFHEIGMLPMDNVMRALRRNIMDIRDGNRGMLVAFILNAILSVMIGTYIKGEEMLEELDRLLLDKEKTDTNTGVSIQQCGQANLILQKNSIPLKTEFSKLLRTAMVKNDEKLIPVYNEVYNQLDFIVLRTVNNNELLTSMWDLYVSNNDLKTNSIMKRLTIVSTLFIPVTFLVGVWGMNFKLMPELELEYGYVIAWILLIFTLISTWIYMKKNKWF